MLFLGFFDHHNSAECLFDAQLIPSSYVARHTHTHSLLYFNRCGRELLNYGVEIKEDIGSKEHTVRLEEIYTQI